MVSSRRSRPRRLSVLPLFLFRSLKCDSSIGAVTLNSCGSNLQRQQVPVIRGV